MKLSSTRIGSRWLATVTRRVGIAGVVTAVAAGIATLASADSPTHGSHGGSDPIDAARELTLALDPRGAEKALDGADRADPLVALERARAALYQGDCRLAAGLLSRPGLDESDAGAQLGAIARGCVRSMAGAVTVEDEDKGVVLRFQDDEDVVLAPMLADVAAKARELYKRDLGVELPRPIRVEVVRDQFGLAAMTGLPIEAARTTGTIAIAKWGRVVMVSPRGAPRGYSYLDTLAHELSHLAQTRASKDRAPLWLQEGVARIEETRWRPPRPFDDFPSADDLAAFGFQNHLGPDIDKIGPSIAMLPSAEEAQVTYAKVMSFIRYWSKVEGENALPRLLEKMGQAKSPEEVEKAIEAVSGTSFSSWAERWQKDVLASAKELPEDLKPGAPPTKHLGEVRKRVRLGELFAERKHPAAAKAELTQAFDLAPMAIVRANLAAALLDLGENEAARALVEKTEDIRGNDARWWALHGRLVPGDAERSRAIAVGMSPYDPDVVCAPSQPADPRDEALCAAARRKPR
jgi:hypothetical protein